MATKIKFPLSARTVWLLELCEHATHDKPKLGLTFFQGEYLRNWGLLDYRGFDGKTHGGHFITPAGREALRKHRENVADARDAKRALADPRRTLLADLKSELGI